LPEPPGRNPAAAVRHFELTLVRAGCSTCAQISHRLPVEQGGAWRGDTAEG